MRTIYFTIYVLVLATLVISCSKDNLDVAFTREKEDEFFTSEAKLERGIRGVYAGLTDLYSFNGGNTMHELYLLPADDFTRMGGDSYETFRGLQPGDGKIGAYYDILNRLVNRANTMLSIQEAKKDLYSGEEVYRTHRGELLFLRAFAFFRLWHNWEKAPIITERVTSLDPDHIFPPASEGLQGLDQAIADLNEAAGLLANKNEWDAQNKGRITVNSVYGFLVKLHVVRAGYTQNKDQDYQKAIEAFAKIDQSVVQLTAQYGANFDVHHEHNSESLFEFAASDAPSGDNPFLDNDFGGNIGRQGSSFSFWDTMADGWAWQFNPFLPTEKLIRKFHPEDPRFRESMGSTVDYQNEFGRNAGDLNRYVTGYAFHKYVLPGKIAYGLSWTQSTTLQNPRILRFADVKLCVAEAYLETGNPGAALEQVNDIRSRARNSVPAGEPASAHPANLTDVNRQVIMDERMRELAGEDDHRWVDLKRWQKAGWIQLDTWTKEDNGTDQTWGTVASTESFEFEISKNLLLPIPASEIQRNPNIGGNNSGY